MKKDAPPKAPKSRPRVVSVRYTLRQVAYLQYAAESTGQDLDDYI